METQLQEELPRASLYKTRGSVNKTVQKREIIRYTSDLPTYEVRDGMEAKARFRISGECCADMRNSFFTLRLKTNKWTAHLPSTGVTSIVKKVEISFPYAGNQILESVDHYNTLASMIMVLNCSPEQRDSNWYAAQIDNPRKARSYLLAEGGWKTLLFNLNVLGIFSQQEMLPLFILNGIDITITFASPTEAFQYDPANETALATDFGGGADSRMIEFPVGRAEIRAVLGAGGGAAGAAQAAMRDRFNRPFPPNHADPLIYQIERFEFHMNAVWMSEGYVSAVVKQVQSGQGFNLFYETYWSTLFDNNGADHQQFLFSEQYQNLKMILFGCLHAPFQGDAAQRSFDTFYNYFSRFNFRQGSRVWEEITNENDNSALSYVRALLSMDQFSRAKATSLTSGNFTKSRNVLVFDLQRVIDKGAHSGLDTTLGRTLSLNVDYNRKPGFVIQDGGGQDVQLVPEIDPSHSRLVTFAFFTRMLNISSKGLSISQ